MSHEQVSLSSDPKVLPTAAKAKDCVRSTSADPIFTIYKKKKNFFHLSFLMLLTRLYYHISDSSIALEMGENVNTQSGLMLL